MMIRFRLVLASWELQKLLECDLGKLRNWVSVMISKKFNQLVDAAWPEDRLFSIRSEEWFELGEHCTKLDRVKFSFFLALLDEVVLAQHREYFTELFWSSFAGRHIKVTF